MSNKLLSTCSLTWIVYLPSTNTAALFLDIIAIPAEPVKPVAHANRSFSGGIYSDKYSSSWGTIKASSLLFVKYCLISDKFCLIEVIFPLLFL